MPLPYRTLRLNRRLAAELIAVVFALGLLAGCGGETRSKLDGYLEELEVHSALNAMKEIHLGYYRISSATVSQDSSRGQSEPIWVKIKFHLYAITDLKTEAALLRAIERHRGMINHTVITTLRDATIEELEDNRWATIKSRVTEELRPLLGEELVRQVTFDNFTWEPI